MYVESITSKQRNIETGRRANMHERERERNGPIIFKRESRVEQRREKTMAHNNNINYPFPIHLKYNIGQQFAEFGCIQLQVNNKRTKQEPRMKRLETLLRLEMDEETAKLPRINIIIIKRMQINQCREVYSKHSLSDRTFYTTTTTTITRLKKNEISFPV